MEYFPMLHGTITCVGKGILAVRFVSVEGYESEAVAVKEVCYVGGRQSKALHLDFEAGHQVPFSAVRDPSSVEPEVWKTIVLWTTSKPHSFNLCDWEVMVSKLYTNGQIIRNILGGIVDFKRSQNIECRALSYLHMKVLRDLEEGIDHHIDDCDLNQLLGSEDIFSDYVETIYGSVAEFMMCHSAVFQVSADGRVFSLKAVAKFNQYVEFVSNQILEENDQMGGSVISDSSTSRHVHEIPHDQMNGSEMSDNSSVRNVHKVFRLEKAAIRYFTTKLRGIQQNLGVVFCLSSKTIEELLERAPEEIAFYVRKTYRSLTNFVDFHRYAFLIGPCSTVFPNTPSKLQVYLTEGLENVIPNDDFADLLYEMFVQKHELGSKTKQEFENKTDSQKSMTQNGPPKSQCSEELYFSETEECSVGKSKIN